MQNYDLRCRFLNFDTLQSSNLYLFLCVSVNGCMSNTLCDRSIIKNIPFEYSTIYSTGHSVFSEIKFELNMTNPVSPISRLRGWNLFKRLLNWRYYWVLSRKRNERNRLHVAMRLVNSPWERNELGRCSTLNHILASNPWK